ncbi:MAG: hypothetical protein MUC96_05025 [Myxococcaceae bacterium]|jgi:hypothetical protein|nr:hypothetical protein [Myxococcaceae bacterium]
MTEHELEERLAKWRAVTETLQPPVGLEPRLLRLRASASVRASVRWGLSSLVGFALLGCAAWWWHATPPSSAPSGASVLQRNPDVLPGASAAPSTIVGSGSAGDAMGASPVGSGLEAAALHQPSTPAKSDAVLDLPVGPAVPRTLTLARPTRPPDAGSIDPPGIPDAAISDVPGAKPLPQLR